MVCPKCNGIVGSSPLTGQQVCMQCGHILLNNRELLPIMARLKEAEKRLDEQDKIISDLQELIKEII